MYMHFYVHIDLHKLLHTTFRRMIIPTEGKKKEGSEMSSQKAETTYLMLYCFKIIKEILK